MAAYGKAIAAFLTGLVGLLAQFGLNVDVLTPEVISAVTTVVTTLLVYFLPNKGA